MTRKERLEYRRQRLADQAKQLSSLDREMLDLMERLRRYTHSCELGAGPRYVALQALRKAIDELGGAVTGDPEYFHAKHQSIG